MRHLCDMAAHAQHAFRFVAPERMSFQYRNGTGKPDDAASGSSRPLMRKHSSDAFLQNLLVAALKWKPSLHTYRAATMAAAQSLVGETPCLDPALVLVPVTPFQHSGELENPLFMRILGELLPQDLVSASLVSRLWWWWVKRMLGY
jgi:hypothetical protein